MSKTDKLREKIEEIMDKYFPDEFDSQMYHPGTGGVADELLDLIRAEKRELLERVEEIIHDSYLKGSAKLIRAIPENIETGTVNFNLLNDKMDLIRKEIEDEN